MESAGGRLVSKAGAEGLECMGLPARGLGAALKCLDGSSRGIPAAVIALLDHLGWLEGVDPASLSANRKPSLRNHTGTEVGGFEVSLDVLAPSSRVL